MKRFASKRKVVSTGGAALLVGLLFTLLGSKPAVSQGQTEAAKSVESKPTPRTPDGHPDLNGLWNDSRTGNPNPADRVFEKSSDGSILFDFSLADDSKGQCADEACQDPNQAPYKPEYLAKVKEIAKTFNGNSTPLDPEMQCKPYGIPRGAVGGTMQIVQTPKVIAILYEGHPQPSSIYRIVYMDSPHPPDLDTTYMGDSRGHWEGDTLVVDVTGLNDETWLAGAAGVSVRFKYTTIHSDKEHVIERWTRQGDTITYQATVEDPIMFTRPWVLAPKRIHLDTDPNDQLLELFCTPEATGGNHFVAPNEDEQATFCHSIGKDVYDACIAAAKKKAEEK